MENYLYVSLRTILLLTAKIQYYSYSSWVTLYHFVDFSFFFLVNYVIICKYTKPIIICSFCISGLIVMYTRCRYTSKFLIFFLKSMNYYLTLNDVARMYIHYCKDCICLLGKNCKCSLSELWLIFFEYKSTEVFYFLIQRLWLSYSSYLCPLVYISVCTVITIY